MRSNQLRSLNLRYTLLPTAGQQDSANPNYPPPSHSAASNLKSKELHVPAAAIPVSFGSLLHLLRPSCFCIQMHSAVSLATPNYASLQSKYQPQQKQAQIHSGSNSVYREQYTLHFSCWRGSLRSGFEREWGRFNHNPPRQLTPQAVY